MLGNVIWSKQVIFYFALEAISGTKYSNLCRNKYLLKFNEGLEFILPFILTFQNKPKKDDMFK